MTRRNVVRTAAAAGVLAAAGSLVPGTASAASRAGTRQPRKLPTSANGWTVEKEANRISTVWTRPVAGTGLSVDVRIGDVEAILVHVIRRFHYEIEQLHRGDLVGWQPARGLRGHLPESNLASGTAVRIRPGSRAKGGFFAPQLLVLRDILAECEGVVRWSGDDRNVDESLFSIAAGPDDGRVRVLGDRFRRWGEMPGEGAGSPVDVRAPARLRRAEGLARAQSQS
ncbi:Hypothetical protein SCLAV_2284 [Streptomyces clavuligerus]|uniref:Secreted protein n=2 Tax=Streptomyces clavuligerus TaxID=1901 RepID=E2Q7F1_STRCL|nr:Hypothetical protein SCLAV_2284 [Streptomyces clavuligerus]